MLLRFTHNDLWGLKVQVLVYGNRIELIPLKEISEMRGFLKGINTEIEREPERI